MLGARERCAGLMDLIDGKQFFVLHAARQTGKTTLLNNLEQELNAGEYEGNRYPIELKIRRNDKTIADGRRRLARYLDTLGEPEGWLIVFDQRPERAWDDKISWTTETVNDKTLHILGC